MKERQLLGILEPVLEIIENQDFRDPQHREKVERIHRNVTVKLLAMGAGEKVIQLRFEAYTRHSQGSSFVPRIVDKLPAINSRAGWINEPDGSLRSVERELLGRTCERIIGNLIVIREYFRPEGNQDDDLFQIARRHNGSTGMEGVVRRTVAKKEARALFFTGTGSDKNEKAQKTLVAA